MVAVAEELGRVPESVPGVFVALNDPLTGRTSTWVPNGMFCALTTI